MIKTREGQNMFDVAIQNFGNIDNVFDVIDAGDNLSLTSELNAGTELELSTENNGDEAIKEFYRRRLLITNNASPPGTEAVGGDYNDDYNNDYN